MNARLTPKQKNMLNNDLIVRKESEDYRESINDLLLELFLSIDSGIEKNGLTVPEIGVAIGMDIEDYKILSQARTIVSQFVTALVKNGFPFGGIKDKDVKLKKYNFSSNKKEWEKLQYSRIKRITSELTNTLNYIDDENMLSITGKKLLTECNKQLTLF